MFEQFKHKAMMQSKIFSTLPPHSFELVEKPTIDHLSDEKLFKGCLFHKIIYLCLQHKLEEKF